MLRYAVARIVWTIPVLLLAITLTFFLVRATGGDPFRHGRLVGLTGNQGWVKYGDYKPESIRGNLERRYGLDLPWYEQYANYVAGVFTFSLGPSLSFRYRSVDEIIARHAPTTLELCTLALAWAVPFGLAVGALSALRPRSLTALVERVLSALSLSIPAFLVGTVLIYVFALKTGVLPTSGWDGWRAKILPSLTLGLVPMALCARLTRGGVRETLGQDYVRAARAKGLRGPRIITVHVLRNSVVPVLSAAGPIVGALITTAFVVEQVFAIPGLARHYVSAATARDYPLLMGMTVVFTVAVILVNLVADLMLAAVEPRIRERV
jgi:oligopeptide transport system permease protein